MILDDVRAYLIAQGATDANWTQVYIGYLPDDLDRAIAIFEYPGEPPESMQRETELVSLQMRVRGTYLDYPTTRLKWKQCFDILQDAQQVSGSPLLLPGVVFIQARAYGPLHFNDEKGRPNFSTNFRVKRYYS